MPLLVYLHSKESGLIFEDWVEDPGDNEKGSTHRGWATICKKHAKELTFDGGLSECAAEETCGVLGCKNSSDFYLDFDEEDTDDLYRKKGE